MFNIICENLNALNKENSQFNVKFENFFYKLNNTNYSSESITEELSSIILSFSTLKDNDFLMYEQGFLNGIRACKSKIFLKQEESLFDFNILSKRIQKYSLEYLTNKFYTVQEKAEYTINFIKQNYNVDVTNYIKNCITLDYIIKNTDRDFNNLSLIENNKKYRTAPIYDNAAGLMSCEYYDKYKSIEDNLKNLMYKPFSRDINEMYNYFGPGFQVNFKELLYFLNENYNIKQNEYGYIQLQILKYQCEKLKESELNIDISLSDKIEKFNIIENSKNNIILNNDKENR